MFFPSQPIEQHSSLGCYAEWFIDPSKLKYFIIRSLDNSELINDIINIVVEYLHNNKVVFGPNDWNNLIGRVHSSPPPARIEHFLHQLDAVHPGKKYSETCFLVYVPTLVDGKPLNISRMVEIANKMSNEGKINPNYISFYRKLGEKRENLTVYRSYWLLMNKKAIPQTIGKNFDFQENFVRRIAFWGPQWVIPNLLEVITAAFTNHVKNGAMDISLTTRCNDWIPDYDFVDVSTNGIALKQILYYEWDAKNRMKPKSDRAGVVAALRYDN